MKTHSDGSMSLSQKEVERRMGCTVKEASRRLNHLRLTLAEGLNVSLESIDSLTLEEFAAIINAAKALESAEASDTNNAEATTHNRSYSRRA